MIGINNEKILKFTERDENKAKKNKFEKLILSIDLKKKYKEKVKNERYNISLYKKLSPNILGVVTYKINPIKLKKKFLYL